jgi:hypothetical protein
MVCRPRTAAAGGRPLAGLDGVEKVLTATRRPATAVRDAGTIVTAPASRIRSDTSIDAGSSPS